MNLVELYQQTPANQHGNIRVLQDKVFVNEGDTTMEYLLGYDGELWPISSPMKDIAVKVRELERKLDELKVMVSR